jgi:hypothetical protein
MYRANESHSHGGALADDPEYAPTRVPQPSMPRVRIIPRAGNGLKGPGREGKKSKGSVPPARRRSNFSGRRLVKIFRYVHQNLECPAVVKATIVGRARFRCA